MMFKKFFPLLITTLLSANTLKSSPQTVPLDTPFSIESNSSIFDTTVSYTHKPLLTCKPSLNAIYKIKSDKELKVIPRERLQSDTSYICKYKENAITLQTQPIQVEEYHLLRKERLLRLSFNAPLELKNIKKHIKLYKKEKLATTNLNYKIEQNDKTVLLQITEPISNNTIDLKIEGIPSLKDFSTSFDATKTLIKLDKEKKPMNIADTPQMIALESGEFALRIFLEDTLEGKPEESIEIEGIDNFRLDKDNYIDGEMRKKFKLSDSVYYYTDVISQEFKANSSYMVTLKKGFKNYEELKEDKHYTLNTGDRAKTILFEDDKPYISNSGELGFKSTNIDSATIIVERLLDENLRYFINFDEAKEDKVTRYTKEIFSKKLTLNNQKNKITKQKFKLSNITSDLPFGVYNITLRYEEDGKEKSQNKIIFLSNLAISLNLAKDQAFVTVLSLDKAQPIESAEIELFGANNQLIGLAQTDKNGVAVVSKDKLLDKNPKGIVVTYKKDKNFLALKDTIDSPTPEDILEKEERFKAHIYFQSKLIRPEGELNALITIKDRDFISASKIPIEITLSELYGKVIQTKVYHTDEYGLINFHHQFDNEDRTGNYELFATIGKSIIGSKIFKVESFMPPKIENHISTTKESYYMGEFIESNISTNYLFGAVGSGLSGQISLDSEAVEFRDFKYKQYTFINQNIAKSNREKYLEQKEDIRLDKQGRANIILPTNIRQRVPSILEVMLGVTIMDDTQPVSNYKKLTLYPYRAMVGLRLEKTHFEKGQKLEGKAIIIDPMTKEMINRKLYATIKKTDWHYSYSEGEYNWEKETTVVDNFEINASQKFSRVMHENGDYTIEVHDHLGGHSSSGDFDVWWQDYSNVSPKDSLKTVEIKFENRLYKKGDKLKASIKSPILKGELFITLEGDRVESYQHVSIDNGVAQIEIPIEHDLQRGAYIHASVYRASDSSSNLIPFRAMGYKFIKPNREQHKIGIVIDAPKESRSNTTVALKINSDKKSKLLVSVIDSGILQLANQEDPKIFDFFNEKPSKNLSYYDLYDQLMEYITEGNLISFGAGDGMRKKRKHLPPDLGKRVKPFMIWSGVVEPKENNASIGIDIPEFNGRATIIAIAINQDSIGVASKEITIKDDIMIKPSYPKYTLKGDELEVPIRLFNTTKESKKVILESNVSSNLNLNLTSEAISIPANSSKLIQAKLTAIEIGKGEIVITANFENKKVINSLELPIYNPYTISTKTFKGISNVEETFKVPAKYKDAEVSITLSDNLLGAMRDDLKYLISYPYGCAEQTSSKISAMHYAKAFLKDDKLLRESKNFIRQGIKKLLNMQNSYGEFSYWESGGDINPYASLYTAQTLLELNRNGIDIPSSTIRKIITMLKSVSSSNANYLAKYSEFHRLYSAYILAEDNKLDSSTANMLLEKAFYKKYFLSTLYMSAILKIQGDSKEAEKIYASLPYKLSDYQQKSYRDYSGNFESSSRDMLIHFIIKSRYFNKDQKDLATVQKSLNQIYSTQEKAIALKAISIYLGEPKDSNLNVKLTINGEDESYKRPTSFNIDKITSDTISITPKSGAVSYSIELIKRIPKVLKNELSDTKELSIMREFVDENNQTIDMSKLRQGDKIYSKITIANRGKINNVVVSQRVPSCFSIVNNNIQSTKERFKNININQQYREIRDDRVLHFINLDKKEKYDKATDSHKIVENIGTIFTPFIVTTKGECRVPAVISEAMYDSRLNDYAKDFEMIKIGKSQ